MMCAGEPPPTCGLGPVCRSTPSRSAWISLSREVSRSASRRELANTIELLVRLDQVDDALLDVRPDRVVLEVGHVGHRHLHRKVERLGRRRRDDRRRGLPGQETRHLLRRSHRRRQPDALRGFVQQLVQPLQRQRQMSTPFGGGDRVHLVDDDGLHRRERIAGSRRQHQEQRLGGGDQDVGRFRDELSPPSRRGVAGADADADLWRLLPVPLGDAGDPGQRSAEVALDVDGQRLQRRHVQDAGARTGRAVVPRRAGRSPRETRQASCRTRSARRPACCRRRRWRTRPAPGRRSAPRRCRRTTLWSAR